MSIYATINESEPEFFSSNDGWSDVIAWSESLDSEEFEPVIQLCEHGICEGIDELRSKLQSAIANHPPVDTVAKTLAELLDLLDGESGFVLVSNGMSVASN